jgi:hypothetical protein
VETRRGGRLGDGNEGVALERGRARQTARGGRKGSAGGSVLRGVAGREARRDGRRVEAEWKRERGPWARRGAARRRVLGAAVARPRRARVAHCHCRATVEDGGVGATRSTWLIGGPGRDGGPVISGLVRRGEAVGAALIGGVGSTVRPIRFSNRIKLISNGFKFAPNFDRSKRCLSLLQKFQIKYG